MQKASTRPRWKKSAAVDRDGEGAESLVSSWVAGRTQPRRRAFPAIKDRGRLRRRGDQEEQEEVAKKIHFTAQPPRFAAAAADDDAPPPPTTTVAFAAAAAQFAAVHGRISPCSSSVGTSPAGSQRCDT